MQTRLSSYRFPLSVLALFALIFALVSFPNHYFLRTAALDLGMFNHAVYDFGHGRANYFLLNVHGREVHYFSDHFSPITFLYVPFQWVFGSYALLVVQWGTVLLGGWGIFRLAELHLKNTVQSALVMFHFFSVWGVIYALAAEFHNNVMAAMLVPWLFYFFEKKAWIQGYCVALLIMLAKENMTLWLVFLLSGYGLLRFESLRVYALRYLLPAVFVFGYFLLVVQVIMPLFSGTEENGQMGRYATYLGGTPCEVLQSWFKNPGLFFSLFVDFNTNGKIIYGPKAETWLMLVLSGGLLLLRRPAFLWMILPILVQKFFSGDPVMMGMTHHYSIEFVPILSIALLWAAKEHPQKASWYIIPTLLLTLGATVWGMDHKVLPGYNNANLHFYEAKHYQSVHPDIPFIMQKISKLPADAAVSVSSELAPHLAMRKKIYHFPVIKDAEYIVVISENTNYYPISQEEFVRYIEECKQQGFKVRVDEKDLLILNKHR